MKHFASPLLLALAVLLVSLFAFSGCDTDIHYDSASIDTALEIDASSLGKTFKVHKKLQFDRDLTTLNGLYLSGASVSLDPDVIYYQNNPNISYDGNLNINYSLNAIKDYKIYVITDQETLDKKLAFESRDGYLQDQTSRLLTVMDEDIRPYIFDQRIQVEIDIELNQQFLYDYMKSCGYSVEDADDLNDPADIECPLSFDLSVWFQIDL